MHQILDLDTPTSHTLKGNVYQWHAHNSASASTQLHNILTGHNLVFFFVAGTPNEYSQFVYFL